MKMTSKDFTHEGDIPQIFTCEGSDVSPELTWDDIPQDTKSFALIVHDPDAPFPGGWHHWVMFNIPGNTTHFKQGEKNFPGGTGFGQNSWKRNDYGGPCPPSGKHRYYFRLYALDTILELVDGSKPEAIEKAMKSHILDKAELMGKYIKVNP